jgi:MFS family permease
MFGAKDRGKAVAIASLLPYMGPALGPIIGGVASRYLWWPWLFWILSFCDFGALVLGFFLIRETYGMVLLGRKAEKLHLANKPTRKEALRYLKEDFFRRFGPAMKRPIRLLLRRPVIQLIAIALSIEFGVCTLVLGSFATLRQTKYHQSASIASLHYIAIGIGAIASPVRRSEHA